MRRRETAKKKEKERKLEGSSSQGSVGGEGWDSERLVIGVATTREVQVKKKKYVGEFSIPTWGNKKGTPPCASLPK
jgi:hypothetical protein